MKRNLLFLIATAGIALAANLTYADTVSWSNTAPTGANYFDLTILKSEDFYTESSAPGLAIVINYFNADGTPASVLNKQTGQYITQYDQPVGLPGISSTLGLPFSLTFTLNAAGLSMDGVLDPAGEAFGGPFLLKRHLFMRRSRLRQTRRGRTCWDFSAGVSAVLVC